MRQEVSRVAGHHIQTQTEWEEQMAVRVLSYIRDVLCADYRFFRVALSIWEPVPDGQLTTLATDGTVLRFSAGQLLRLFRDNDRYLNRLYLHTALHCLFEHLWIGGGRERAAWNLACDIAVEYVIDHMDKPCTKRIVGWVRQKIYEELEEGHAISAAVIYGLLLEKDAGEREALHQEFFADDHRYWPQEERCQAVPQSARQAWSRAARQIRLEQRRRGEEPKEGERLMQAQFEAGRRKRSYRDFLRKFAVYREEMQVSLDEFDLNYYMYGLSLYGDMPLVEPLESSEVKKIQDFVVVVDTSYSTSGELVRGFLQETFDILKGQDDFFRHADIRILQCDEKVQRDDLVTSKEDLERLFRDFKIYGGGGTDFRPAFAYISELVEEGAFKNLCGILYFTDGKGIYPSRRPPCPAAFLFLEDYEEDKVPSWAMRLRVDRDEWRAERHKGPFRNNSLGVISGSG